MRRQWSRGIGAAVAIILAVPGCGREGTGVTEHQNGATTETPGVGEGASAETAGSNAAAAPIPLVAVAAQRCTRPVADRGLGVVIGEDLVATAAHTVEGDLRQLTVDGLDATVVALDARTDLALVSVPLDAPPAVLSIGDPGDARGAAWLHDLDARTPVEIVRTAPLIVHDATTRRRHERLVHTFTPGVEAGSSGAPLISADGELIGIVVLDGGGADIAYAVTSGELRALLERGRRNGPGTAPACAS